MGKIGELQKQWKKSADPQVSELCLSLCVLDGANGYQPQHAIVHEQLRRSSLPSPQKAEDRIQQECGSIVAAGVDTVSWSTSVNAKLS